MSRHKLSRPVAAGVAALALVALGGWGLSLANTPAAKDLTQGDPPIPRPEPAGTTSKDPQVLRGEYLARVGDCIACHTAPGGKPFAGGLPMASPIGTIYSTNITPDKDTGIGRYTLEDFDKALRHGIAREGHTLYPAMPYTSYAYVKPEDIQSLYTYFMQGVAPVAQANRDTDIRWPLSMRWPLSLWRRMFAPTPVAAAAPVPEGDRVALGRYLVQGLGHCSTCHTPRGVAFQEKSGSDGQGPDFLAGAVLDGWLARNLRGDKADGLGTWSEKDIVDLLKTGRNAHGATFGSMAEVVQHSTQYMTDADLQAMGAYLKTLPARDANAPAPAYQDSAAKAMYEGTVRDPGALLYIDNCAACHRTSGKGYDGVFPPLALNPTLNGKDPTSVIHIILQGAQMPSTRTALTHFAMPGFADRLTDAEVAQVASFVRKSWGNQGPEVTAEAVRKMREETRAAAAPVR